MTAGIIDYKVLKTTDTEALAKLVMNFLSKGWDLCGGVSVTSSFNKVYYAQAMVKYGEH